MDYARFFEQQLATLRDEGHYRVFADLARHKGLAVWKSIEDTDQLIGDAAPTFIVSSWNPTLPFWQWLADLSGSG